MPVVSVILPIYNAESYLRQCLDSIKAQTLQDIEVICVNDGSTDDSLAIMREYAIKDSRFMVLDKPNGGYGHTLNHGLSHVQGEYIAIVEPDDFIDAHMYEDLYAFSTLESGKADVVKGSYVEYYDGRDGFEEQALIPNISYFMRKEPYAFSLRDDCEVFCHHPSIWSAIYRKEFLDSKKIKFVEPKGAGWADNPFFAETLTSAESIVWVPKAYYYYRQTNSGASSFLKDFHIPFARSREMRDILRRNDVPKDVWAAFYLREFDYIFSVIGEFGFAEGDPEIQSLIREVLEDMDESLVLTHPRLRQKDIRYYKEFLEQISREPSKASVVDVDASDSASDVSVSFIVPVENDAKWISECLESVLCLPIDGIEVVCVDCGSKDRSMSICRRCAEGDARVSLLPGCFAKPGAGIANAISRIRGEYFFIVDASFAFRKDAFSEALKEAMDLSLDVVVFDGERRFTIDVMRVVQSRRPLESDGKEKGVLFAPFKPCEAGPFLFNLARPHLYSKLYRKEFVIDNGIAFSEEELVGDAVFGARSLLAARKIGYAPIEYFQELDREVDQVPFCLDLRENLVKEKPLLLPEVLRFVDSLRDEEGLYSQTIGNLLVESFMWDMLQRRSCETIKCYADEYGSAVGKAIPSALRGRDFFDVNVHNDYQLLTRRGLEFYLANRCLVCERDARYFWNELDDLRASLTMKIGARVSRVAQSVLPSGIVGRIRGAIASSRK